MVFHRSRLVFHGFSWFQVGFHSSRTVFIVFHGSRLFFHGFSWFVMVFHGFSWFYMVPGWFFHVFSWFFMVSGWFFIFHVESTLKLYSGPTIQSRHHGASLTEGIVAI